APNFSAGTDHRHEVFWLDSIGRIALVEDAVNRDRFWRPANAVVGSYLWRLIQRADGSPVLPIFTAASGSPADITYDRDGIVRRGLDHTQRTTSERDELGRLTTYQWTGATQQPSRIDHPDGSFETWTRQAGTGEPLAHADRLGRVTTWERTATGLVT